MAGFKGHLIFGVIAATLYTGSLLLLSNHSFEVLRTVFFLTTFSAILPDIDSQTGVPAQIVFSILSIATMLFLFNHFRLEHYISITDSLIAIVSGLSVYPLLQTVFKHFTVHRGAFHSIPMAIILGLITASILTYINTPNDVILALSFSVLLGYLCHLLLDELVSLFVKGSLYFKPKKSFGTALKITANSSLSTAITYIALCSLTIINKPFLKYAYKALI